MNITTTAGTDDNNGTGNRTQLNDSTDQPENKPTTAANNEAGKVSGEHQNNGYGNTPGEEDPVDPDMQKSNNSD